MVKKAIIIGLCLGLFLRLAFAATPVTFQYHYDEKGQLVTVEDSTGKVLQYVYDPVGNLLATITATQTTKPTITGIVPNTLRQGQSAAVTLSGSALLGARVISPSSALAVGNVQPGKNSVSFNLTAEVAAPLGAQNFNLMTNAGSTGFSITVKPLLPAILVSPSPIVLTNNGNAAPYTLSLANVDDVDHIINLAVSDPNTATVDKTSVTIPAGQTNAVINIQGLAIGNTALNLTSPDLTVRSIPVFVPTSYVGPIDGYAVSVRVVKQTVSNPIVDQKGPFVAPSVRIVKQVALDPPLNQKGPFVAPTVRVVKQVVTDPAVNQKGPFIAPTVRVVKQVAPDPVVDQRGPFIAPSVQVIKQTLVSNPPIGPFVSGSVRVTKQTATSGLSLNPLLAPSVAVQKETAAPVAAASVLTNGPNVANPVSVNATQAVTAKKSVRRLTTTVSKKRKKR